MKRSVKYILIPVASLIILYVLYMAASRVLYWWAWQRGDYPGPLYISSQPLKKHQPINWLLLHGASQDARQWSHIIKQYPKKQIIAISLGNHQLGPLKALPNKHAADDIVKFLKEHHVIDGIVAHSTSAIWLAEAKFQCPSCFSNKLKIILLAPNFSNPRFSSLKTSLFLAIPPVIYWAFLPIRACKGLGKHEYYTCKKQYMFGRLYRISSTHYYKELRQYCLKKEMKNKLINMMSSMSNLIVYLSNHDTVLSNKHLILFLNIKHIHYSIIKNVTHNTITNVLLPNSKYNII